MKTKRLLLILSLCYGLNLFGQIPSNIPQNGLVAYYPFNGNANDISGSGNNGIINGELFSTENRFQEPGSAYLFTEGGSGITFQNNNIVFGPQDLTISFWFKRQNCALPCSNNTFFQTDVIDINPFDNIVENQKLSIGIINEKIYVQFLTFEGAPFTQVFSNASNISFNSWIHLTLIIKAQNGGMGSNVGIYINGILDSMMLINYLLPDGSNPQSFSIGSGIDNSNTFNGLIDDFVIYNRELQPNEISQLSSSVNDDIINNNPVPPGIPYQAVARNYQGEPISNSNVQVRFNIRDLNSEGSVVYSETHSLQTDTLGLFSTAIGSGTPSNNGNFNQINWSQTVKYLQVELDFSNGWTDFGTQQLMSVPFALYAGNSQPGPQGPAGPRGITGLTGAAGPQGEQGVAGTDGKNSLVKTSVEPSGATCPSGGVKLEHGLDTNNDGVLDESEINATLTQYVCNGTGNIVNQLPIGGKEGQSLTICNGIAKWTYNGQCFTIDSLNCQSAFVNGSLTSGLPSEQVILSIPYYNTETGNYKSQLINSSGINGLIANLNSGELMADSGMLNLNISGIPSNPGIANFQVVFGEKQCNIEVPVSSISEIQIGDNFGGGIVAYILQSGDIGYSEGQQHGIIVAPYDQSNVSVWGCYGSVVGGTSEEIGTGKSNTNYILMGCEQSGTAAMICDNLQLNGFSDWYLPSIKELEKIYLNLYLSGIGNFSDCGPSCYYWSSSEHFNSGGTTSARNVFFDGYQNGDGGFSFGTLYNKSYTGYVRAVRSF